MLIKENERFIKNGTELIVTPDDLQSLYNVGYKAGMERAEEIAEDIGRVHALVIP